MKWLRKAWDWVLKRWREPERLKDEVQSAGEQIREVCEDAAKCEPVEVA